MYRMCSTMSSVSGECHFIAALAAILLCAVALVARPCIAAGPDGAESRDMRLVGHHDLHSRGAYQPVINQQNGRWIAYIGHHAGSGFNPLKGREEQNGTSIIDVTD